MNGHEFVFCLIRHKANLRHKLVPRLTTQGAEDSPRQPGRSIQFSILTTTSQPTEITPTPLGYALLTAQRRAKANPASVPFIPLLGIFVEHIGWVPQTPMKSHCLPQGRKSHAPRLPKAINLKRKPVVTAIKAVRNSKSEPGRWIWPTMYPHCSRNLSPGSLSCRPTEVRNELEAVSNASATLTELYDRPDMPKL